MQRYILQRLLLTIPTLLGLTMLVFFFLRVALPTDAVDKIVGEYGRNDVELQARLRKQLGLSSSVPSQYLHWVGGIMTGDMGKSLYSGVPVTTEMRRRIPVSLELGIVGLVSSVLVAIPIGMLAAAFQDHWPDYILRGGAVLLTAVPGFWIAILLLTFGSLWFDWAPPIHFKYIYEDPWAHLKIMLVPALLIALTPSGSLIRLVRTQMLEVLRQDYIRTAHAKGLKPRTVFLRHGLRNSLIPVVTVIGLSLPTIVAGTVIFETIFIIPGMGRYLVDSVNNLDYPVIQATNLFFAVLIVLANLIVDVSYGYLDPRIRYG
jgi:peptide/nickel transport system permease protein